MGTSDLFAPPRDLILRPTDAAPGIYGSEDGLVMVTRGPGGGCYVLLWGATPQPGDLVFRDAYMTGHKIEFEDNGAVTVEESILELNPQ